MKRIGYIRVNSKTQNVDRQIKVLKNVSKMFVDKQSMEHPQHLQRPQLKAMLDFICEKDIVVITELDQLSSKNKELIKIMKDILKKGATLEVLNIPRCKGIEDENLRKLINNLIIELYRYQDYQDESEKQRVKERQAKGIGIAKKQGKFKGGKPKYEFDSPKLQQAFKLYLEGETENHIEKVTGINRRTFRRYREKYNVYRQKQNS
ncbi:recombinase family protein [Bacillus cereus]|uniref:recombinase family protein n=1 Tax=Bacillus cereus group TaxID=86661 RepID=UPI0024076CCF|nr:recombinase family protein [Bacillus cereus]MDF9530620.1 recombinase family protein [Bacillus cereus]MDG1578894.1 recombinase family protein [Bacillus cereus]